MKQIDMKKDKLDVWSAGYGGFNNHEEEKDEKIVKFIEKNCSKFLREMRRTGNFLYRGIDKLEKVPVVYLATTPLHRVPIGQSTKAQHILDIIFKLVGFKALRINSVPCTSDIKNASKWGNLHIIFPINGFDYMWCENIHDIGGDFSLERSLMDFTKESGRIQTPLNKQTARAFVEKWGFTNEDFVEAMSAETEISIHGQYVGIQRDEIMGSKILMKAFTE